MAAIPTVDECKPGIRPTGFNVLVVLEPTEEKIGSIYIPQQAQDKEKLVQVRGRIIAMSPAAFDFADWPANARPQIGDAVQIAKLAGIITPGADGRQYRLVNDKDVAAIIDEAAWEIAA